MAHVVNPVVVGEASDLFAAQPITFQSMVEAKRFSILQVQVELFAAQFAEDHGLVPGDFISTRDLNRSILDCGKFNSTKKLPLIKDILDRLYEATTAEYLIYTNVDIGLQPYFYMTIAELARQGYDAFAINRRVVSPEFKSPQDMPAIWSEVGKSHPGWDCIVFHRSLYPKFRLGNVCIGTSGIGRALVYNLHCHGKRFNVFMDKHLTFHIGEDTPWQGEKHRDLLEFNQRESRQVLQQLRNEFDEFNRRLIAEHAEDQLKKSLVRQLVRRLLSLGRPFSRRKHL
jgi:hypothetical protein